MPSISSTTPVLSSSGVSQPDNAGVTAKESDTDRVLLSMKFCFSAPPLTLFTLQWAYTMLLSHPPRKILDPTLIVTSILNSAFVLIGSALEYRHNGSSQLL